MLKRGKATKEHQSLAKQIYNSVRSRSQGMFLWASLVFDQICDSPSPEAIRASLREAPEGLDDMLHHVFKRFDAEEQKHRICLTNLLSWVFCTYSPLYISGLYVILLRTTGHQFILIEEHFRARYASLFDTSGPVAGKTVLLEDVGSSAEQASPDADNFDFVDEPEDSSTDSETEEADPDPNNNFMETGDNKVTHTAGGDGSFKIPIRWHNSTVTFSHARIRDCLATEGEPSTRRWNDCQVVLQDLNMAHLRCAEACMTEMLGYTTDPYHVPSFREYVKGS